MHVCVKGEELVPKVSCLVRGDLEFDWEGWPQRLGHTDFVFSFMADSHFCDVKRDPGQMVKSREVLNSH